MVPPPKKWEIETNSHVDDESEEDSEEEETSSEEEEEDTPATAAKALPVRKKFDDEEDSDDVADNWDEAEDSEEERKKAAAALAKKKAAEAEAAKNKKSKAARIEEHREANRRKQQDFLDSDEDSDEDEADRRARLRKSEQDSDLQHADSLMNVGMGNMTARGEKPIVVASKDKPGEAVDLSALSLFQPATKTQFEALSEVLVPLLRSSSSKPHYTIWLQNFVKQISQDVPSAEIKKVASQLTALSNEKMKEEKARDGTGKKTKAAKTKTSANLGRGIGRGEADTGSYEDGLAEDDFM
ncbi:hypothetical protein BT93_L4489 [Corymbia citriodora subsp. variegata]|uniref:Eukaryotic translation initiation factor 3 subunit J n=1 Tax=Corymbia citriodora subsp. variegata TaxID=360336 RepID=A0A8T0CHY1_CORYI|nr:hypothetical protein BT93_L4489 [Corymbia citriodora subsp. variegata]